MHTEVVQKQVIPRYTSNLQGEAFSVDIKDSRFGRVKLTHSAPYARRVYYNPDGMKFHKTAWIDKDGKNTTAIQMPVIIGSSPGFREERRLISVQMCSSVFTEETEDCDDLPE